MESFKQRFMRIKREQEGKRSIEDLPEDELDAMIPDLDKQAPEDAQAPDVAPEQARDVAPDVAPEEQATPEGDDSVIVEVTDLLGVLNKMRSYAPDTAQVVEASKSVTPAKRKGRGRKEDTRPAEERIKGMFVVARVFEGTRFYTIPPFKSEAKARETCAIMAHLNRDNGLTFEVEAR